MARHRAFPLFEQRDSGHPYEPHSPETLITLGTWRIQRIQIWEKRNFQFTAPLDVCLRLWYDLCFRKQTDTKCTFAHPDKGETLLERCHGCVYLWAVCVDNNLLDKLTVTSPPVPNPPTPNFAGAIFISQGSAPACLAADCFAHAAEPPPQNPLHWQ